MEYHSLMEISVHSGEEGWKMYIQAHIFEIWQSIVDGYKEPVVPPTNEIEIKHIQNNSKATNSLLNGLGELVYTKVVHCKSTKYIWEKI